MSGKRDNARLDAGAEKIHKAKREQRELWKSKNDVIVDEIARLHDELLTTAKVSLEKAIRIGELLTSQKANLQHGEWLPWLKKNVPFSQVSAWRYMGCYERRDELTAKLSTMNNLTDAYRLLSPPTEAVEEVEAGSTDGVAVDLTPVVQFADDAASAGEQSDTPKKRKRKKQKQLAVESFIPSEEQQTTLDNLEKGLVALNGAIERDETWKLLAKLVPADRSRWAELLSTVFKVCTLIVKDKG